MRRAHPLALRVLVSVAALAAATAPVAAPARGQNPGDAVWGAYASGVGYPVNSEALLERAAHEGIDPRCLMTVTVAWMEHPRIVLNVSLGLLNPLVEGVTFEAAQGALYANSPYFNHDIVCTGTGGGEGDGGGGGRGGGGGSGGGGGGGGDVPSGLGPHLCDPQRPPRPFDFETGPGFVTQWYWHSGHLMYCGYMRQGGGLSQYVLEPSGNGYYMWGIDRAMGAYRRVVRLDRAPAPPAGSAWTEAGPILIVDRYGTAVPNGHWWWGNWP